MKERGSWLEEMNEENTENIEDFLHGHIKNQEHKHAYKNNDKCSFFIKFEPATDLKTVSAIIPMIYYENQNNPPREYFP